jgi:hypothetical protein
LFSERNKTVLTQSRQAAKENLLCVFSLRLRDSAALRENRFASLRSPRLCEKLFFFFKPRRA